LNAGQQHAFAAELGRQFRQIHRLSPPTSIPSDADFANLDVSAAVIRSSLPPHLAEQVEDYLARLGPFDRVFVHGDLTGRHAFVENGRLTGIIDWGDAMVADRHYDIIQIFRDTFACEKALLRSFLDACDWPVDRDFPRKALGFAFYRQGMMLVQHESGDVFEPIAARFPLPEIATLDELASELFAI
jgi:hygromycin-B 7''-O-kinase